jgi:uncharacterized protein
MGTLGWLLVVAVGIALGFGIGRTWPGSAAKLSELERQRDAAREDLQTYRQDVNRHFERTAELFDKVTADYRGLYEHLALGARQLSAIRGEAVEQRLAEPEQRRLATAAAQPPAPEPPPEEAPPEEAPQEETPQEEAPTPKRDIGDTPPGADEAPMPETESDAAAGVTEAAPSPPDKEPDSTMRDKA